MRKTSTPDCCEFFIAILLFSSKWSYLSFYKESYGVTDIFAILIFAILSQEISAQGKFNSIVEGKYPAYADKNKAYDDEQGWTEGRSEGTQRKSRGSHLV